MFDEKPLGGFPSAPRLKFPSFLVLIFLDSWIMDYGFLWGVVVRPHRNPLPQNPSNTGLSPILTQKKPYFQRVDIVNMDKKCYTCF
jgi:hypothetical protein